MHRGAKLITTEEKGIRTGKNAPVREGWHAADGLLPLVNGLWDWISWGITRYFIDKIIKKKGIAQIILQGGLDFTFAVALLLCLTVSLSGVLEFYNCSAQTGGYPAILPLENIINKTMHQPLAPDGMWITLMLFSTLFPTACHFIIILVGLLTVVTPLAIREKLADRFEGVQSRKNLIIPTLYLAMRWPVALFILIITGGFALRVLAASLTPVAQMLYTTALATIDIVRAGMM